MLSTKSKNPYLVLPTNWQIQIISKSTHPRGLSIRGKHRSIKVQKSLVKVYIRVQRSHWTRFRQRHKIRNHRCDHLRTQNSLIDLGVIGCIRNYLSHFMWLCLSHYRRRIETTWKLTINARRYDCRLISWHIVYGQIGLIRNINWHTWSVDNSIDSWCHNLWLDIRWHYRKRCICDKFWVFPWNCLWYNLLWCWNVWLRRLINLGLLLRNRIWNAYRCPLDFLELGRYLLCRGHTGWPNRKWLGCSNVIDSWTQRSS